MAALATRLGVKVLGIDHGGGQDPDVWGQPELLGQFDAFIAQSEFAALAFLDTTVPVHVIKGPVDDEFFRPNDQNEPLGEYVLSVGRILPHKGFEYVIEACQPGEQLIVAGTRHDVDYEDFLWRVARGRGVRLEVLERCTDTELRALYLGARVVIQSSVTKDFRGKFYLKPELLGLAPLEAMACGTPTLVGHATALRELSDLPGCLSFQTSIEAGELVHRASTLNTRMERAEIRAAVVEHYGLDQFGRSLWQLLES